MEGEGRTKLDEGGWVSLGENSGILDSPCGIHSG